MEPNSNTPTSEEWPTRFKFHQPCGCGMHIDAETVADALWVLTAEYTTDAHHRCQWPVIIGKLIKYPGLQIGEVVLDYIARTTELTPGGPVFPCGDSWDFTCSHCADQFHLDNPESHPGPPEECDGHEHLCDACADRYFEQSSMQE